MLLREMKNVHSSISHAWLITLLLIISGQMSAQLSDGYGVATTPQTGVSDTLTIIGRDIDEIAVTAPRVQQATTSHNVVTTDELQRENIGQNLPLLLSTIPAIQVTTDDGLGVGYTYFRIRGTDHTRINMTVNDVPLNDSES